MIGSVLPSPAGDVAIVLPRPRPGESVTLTLTNPGDGGAFFLRVLREVGR
jgi:hypothetical protein